LFLITIAVFLFSLHLYFHDRRHDNIGGADHGLGIGIENVVFKHSAALQYMRICLLMH